MNYVENVYICLAAPLIIAIVFVRDRGRRLLIFLLSGMTACILSSYISTFLATAMGADTLSASMELAPIVEECMKFLPALFYIMVFEPHKGEGSDSIIMSAIGFATFENVCFMTQNGATELTHLLIRGFGTGAMHVVCASIMAYGFLRVWDREWLRLAGTFALLAMATTFHGCYNVLVAQSARVANIGYAVPLLTTVLILFVDRHKRILARRGRKVDYND